MAKKARASSSSANPVVSRDALQPFAQNESKQVAQDIEGNLHPERTGGLRGWVWDRTRPYEPLAVELRAGDQVIAEAVADRFDMNLVERAIGNGKHAFTLIANAWPDLPLPVELQVLVAGTQHVLGKVRVNKLADLEGLAQNVFFGHVDGVIGGEVKGWACDLANPSVPTRVDIRVDEEVLQSVVCAEPRGDLRAAGYATGHGGFTFALPHSLLDGKTHAIAVCFSGSQRRLPNGSMVFGFTQMSGLTNYIGEIAASVKQFQQELATVEERLLARHEALLTIQRENIERELQVLRKLLISEAEPRNAPSPSVLQAGRGVKPVDRKVAKGTLRKVG